MHIISKILIGLIAAIHCYILVLEIFLWESRGPVVFSNFPTEMFAQTKVMAANQGLYNGFLAAGLLWALFFIKDMAWKKKRSAILLILRRGRQNIWYGNGLKYAPIRSGHSCHFCYLKRVIS